MIKQLFSLFLFLSIYNTSFAQTKRENIINEEIGKISLKYIKSTDIEKSDVRYMIYLGFQNEKYSTITDIKSVAFMDSVNFRKFKYDLLQAYKLLEKGEKVEMTWTNKNYTLNLYDFNNELYITETKGTDGYTTLSKKDLVKLLENLSMIEYGKDNLLPKLSIDDLLAK